MKYRLQWQGSQENAKLVISLFFLLLYIINSKSQEKEKEVLNTGHLVSKAYG